MWKSIVYCTSSLLRITCVGALGVFFMAKTETDFGGTMSESAAGL